MEKKYDSVDLTEKRIYKKVIKPNYVDDSTELQRFFPHCPPAQCCLIFKRWTTARKPVLSEFFWNLTSTCCSFQVSLAFESSSCPVFRVMK